MRHAIALAFAAGAVIAPAQAWAADVEADVDVEVTSAVGTTALEGCRTVDVARTQRSVLGFVVFRFHQVKKWCWTYPRITSRAVWTYVSDVDPMMNYQGVVSSVGYYYNWLAGIPGSGHYSFRQGKFENCLVWFSCIGTYYAWVKIWVRANGTYSYATGS
jgi:hypothetical protein